MKSPIIALLASVFASSLTAQACLTQPPFGDSLGSAVDVIHPIESLGFSFPLNGTTYTDIHVSDHGVVWLSNGGTPAPPTLGNATYNVGTTGLTGFGPCIAAFWADATPGGAPNTPGEVFFDASVANQFRVTWSGVYAFFNQLPSYSFQMTLFDTGEIQIVWDGDTNNYGSGFTPSAIVGVWPGGGAVLPPASDLSTTTATSDPSLFELFATASTFDLAADGVRLTPAMPGWTLQRLGGTSQCATVTRYGVGCIRQSNNAFERLPVGGFDLAGRTITLQRNADGYDMSDAVAGTFVTPPASAVSIANGDDFGETVSLGVAMPIPNGTTSSITVCSNGVITLDVTGNTVNFAPSEAEFESWSAPAICPMWHDFQPNQAGSGSILYHTVGNKHYVTWDNVFNWGQPIGETFQVQFDTASGDITIVYDAVHNNIGNDYLVGFTSGTGLGLMSPFDLSADLGAGVQIFDSERRPMELEADAPAFGFTWDFVITEIDPISPINIVFLGTGQTPGIELTSIGLQAPNCRAWITSPLGSLTSSASNGSAVSALPIPTNPGLVGVIVTAQSLALTLANPAGLMLSNAVEGTLGF
ncbi:MAG: hypothetical protein AB8H80_17940 [Planctomycetota bacterium]